MRRVTLFRRAQAVAWGIVAGFGLACASGGATSLGGGLVPAVVQDSTVLETVDSLGAAVALAETVDSLGAAVALAEANSAADQSVLDSLHQPEPFVRDSVATGVKGVGESGCTASIPSLVSAVLDAVRPLGVKHLDMPLTPSKLWHAIQAVK